MTTIEKTNLYYDLMLIANDNAPQVVALRRKISWAFEHATGQDLPENGWMVDEMVASTGMDSEDTEKLSTLVNQYWAERN